jgi:DNA gyrase/topoisomerase IV subunit A
VKATINHERQELEEVKADRAKLLESSTVVTNKLREELKELQSQLETERADRQEIEAELSPAKTKFWSGRHTSGEINTRCDHNSPPARPPDAKNQKPTWRTWKPF